MPRVLVADPIAEAGISRLREHADVDVELKQSPSALLQRIPEAAMDGPEIEARTMLLRQQAIEALELLPQVPAELVAAMQNAQSASALTDLTAAYMDIPPEQKQEIL